MTSQANTCLRCKEFFSTPEELLQHLVDSPSCRPARLEPPSSIPAVPENLIHDCAPDFRPTHDSTVQLTEVTSQENAPSFDTFTPLTAVQCSVIIGFVTGLILGYPVSYYFQPSALRAKLSLGAYIEHSSEIMRDKDLASSVVLGFFVAIGFCVVAGYFIGKAIEQKK